ncbi:HtaA domain-containing protein [Streptomyces sp. NBC_01281]|uniref:HtaA domain-containing protein n=1 Tax=Streptomyces sp. NBC_01281 TaxID=2903811 RepID=UPI002E0ED994|nr:HtaA domain-containing protein [Streptomyces sp. NBC_01281]
MPARLRALAAVVCAAVLGALLTATAAHAASRTVQGGRLDWGIKSSFQSYVTGPLAKGSFSLTGGAATVGASQFRFHSASGSYDGGTGAFTASYAGGVHFVGHRQSGGGYELDMTISRPTVRLAGGGGTLYVDITSKAKGTGAVTTSTQVPFAALSLGGIDMKGGGTAVRLNNLPATLTSQGARSFAGYYTAGTALDPVSLEADVRAAPSPRQSTTAAPEPTSKRPAEKPASGAIEDGAVDWGVRRTFREYVTGPVADGKWTLTAGAQDGGALFRFPEGQGTYDKKKHTLTAAFDGAVRFTGHQGLGLRLSALRVSVTDGRGTLYADVASAGLTGRKVPLVTFAAKQLTPKNGLLQLAEVATELTSRGAKAFGGVYRGGTAMDPLTLSVALTDDARLPALPDLGTSASPAPQASRTTDDQKAAAAPRTENTASDTSDGGSAVPLGIAAAVLLAAAAVLALVIVRRRRRRPAPDATPGAEGAADEAESGPPAASPTTTSAGTGTAAGTSPPSAQAPRAAAAPDPSDAPDASGSASDPASADKD